MKALKIALGIFIPGFFITAGIAQTVLWIFGEGAVAAYAGLALFLLVLYLINSALEASKEGD